MNSRQWDFLDLISVMSFLIGVANYDENLTQGDKQDLLHEVDEATEQAIQKVREHLTEQDKKIERILEILRDEDKTLHGNDSR